MQYNTRQKENYQLKNTVIIIIMIVIIIIPAVKSDALGQNNDFMMAGYTFMASATSPHSSPSKNWSIGAFGLINSDNLLPCL